VLLAPIDMVVGEEPFAHEKLCPVLAVVKAQTAQRGIEAARAVVRLGGAGHSAAIHSTDEHVIMQYAARVPVLRVAVNVGNSTGSAGLSTNLAPSMTLGTGFVGHSSIGENLEPRHLVNWTRVAYNAAPAVLFGDFTDVTVWRRPDGAVPSYPRASNVDEPTLARPGLPVSTTRPATTGTGSLGADAVGRYADSDYADRADSGGAASGAATDGVREQLRALIIEELAQLIGR
jgi:hypothetical protein